jgi:uncharacterized pyridoxamine 5'-phosphate oxidase family protein
MNEKLNEVLKNLRQAPIFVATVSGDKPSLRPFGPAIIFDEHIYLLTSNNKDVYRQLKSNPNIEIVNMLGENSWQRLSAQAELTDKPKIMEAFIKDYAWVGDYHQPNDGHSVALKLKKLKARVYDDGQLISELELSEEGK